MTCVCDYKSVIMCVFICFYQGEYNINVFGKAILKKKNYFYLHEVLEKL